MSDRHWLFSLEQIGIKLGLEQIRALLGALGHPESAYPSIVIAGTNGKGSVTAMVERALRAAGYTTGRYTSPHLVDLEERFAINGRSIEPAALDALAARVRHASASLANPPSFFEATTALALDAFRDAPVDIAVLEVGLGGRLDATNAVSSLAVAITAVDFDHQAYLGHTLEAIATEKAGVIKPGGLVVLGENPDIVRDVVSRTATQKQARLVYVPDGLIIRAAMAPAVAGGPDGQLIATFQTARTAYRDVRLGLRGRHQLANASVAIRLLEELDRGGRIRISPDAIRTGLEDVVWPGRLEWRSWRGHDVLIDGAHNPAGARALADYVREVFPRPLPLVIGAMKDKDAAEMLTALAPIAASFVCTAAQSSRAFAPEELASLARAAAPGVDVHLAATPTEALTTAAAIGSPVIVAGSLYLAGEIRSVLLVIYRRERRVSLRTSLSCWLLTVAGAGVLLCGPRVALAQNADPLAGCTPDKRRIENFGPSRAGNPDAGFLRINVHIICNETEIFAEDVTWNEKTLFATGDVLVSQTGLRLNAARMEMDRVTHLAIFYNAYGTASASKQPGERTLFGTGEADIMFRADKIERLGPKTYRLTHGAFSTCLQANPRWEMVGGTGTIVMGDHASLTNVRFKVKSLPVLYIPYIYYPLRKDDRSTGILIPSYSSSGVRGQGISNAFFYAMNKSMDATLFHDYYTKSGQGGAVEFRFASGQNAGGNAKFHVLDEKERLDADGNVIRNAHRIYDFVGSVNQPLGKGFQLSGNSNYFTDITAQQVYQQDIQALSNRQRQIYLQVTGSMPLTKEVGAPRLQIRGVFQRTEIFSGTLSSLQGSSPRVNVALGDTAFRRSRTSCSGAKPSFFCQVFFRASGEAAYLQSRPFDPLRPEIAVRRFDSSSGLSAPLSRKDYFRVQAGASLQLTEWLDSLNPLTGLPVATPITRNLLNLHAEATGLSFERIFLTPQSSYATGYKHVIEPRVTVDWLSSFDRESEIIQIDGVDRLVGGTTRVNYSLTNTVLAHTRKPNTIRNLLTLTVGQTYYTKPQAGAVDPSNPSASAGAFTPVSVTAVVNARDNVGARFSVYKNSTSWATPTTPAQPAQNVSYTASAYVRSDRLDLTAGWSRITYFTAAQGFFDLPDTHALNWTSTVRAMDKRVGATYGFNFDVFNRKFLQQRIIVYYHAQCCGIAMDYQIYSSLLPTVPVDRRFAVTFTLAGIGSFSPPLGAFGR